MLFFLHLICLSEYLPDAPYCYSVFHPLLYDSFPCTLIDLSFFVLVALHGVSLARAGLSIGENGGMEALHDLVYQASDL